MGDNMGGNQEDLTSYAFKKQLIEAYKRELAKGEKAKVMAPKKRNGVEVEAPEGFDVNLGREKTDGWVAKKANNIVQGRLISRHEYKSKAGKTRAYYQLELQAKCWINPNMEDGEEEEYDEEGNIKYKPPVEMEAGKIVNMDEVKLMEDIRKGIDIINRGGLVDVWTGFKVKEPNRGGEGSHWTVFGPKLRVVKQPKVKEDHVPF